MKWKSKSRIHGDYIEKYVSNNVYCLYCENILCNMNTNFPSIDLKCSSCNKFYQVKDDIDYLMFVGENGRKWFEENGTVKANVKLLSKLLNFDKLK